MFVRESGDERYLRPYLPKDKQYLITRHVPCAKRVAVLESQYDAETEVEAGADGVDDGWLATHANVSKDVEGICISIAMLCAMFDNADNL